MLTDRDALCALIPHAGSMCLIDKLLAWDEEQIQCQTNSHRQTNNPLRDTTGLSAIHGIEYGAQAIAIHGGLLARQRGEKAAPGYLAALRHIEMHTDWLHDIAPPLLVEARRLLGDNRHFIYEFSLREGSRILVAGRATIMLQGQT